MAFSSTVLTSNPAPGILRITLNRPRSLNALNVELLTTLVEVLREAQADARVIILEGAGDRAFCAGEDLKETLAPKTGSAIELRKAFDQLQDLTRLTSSSSAIVISAVQGFAVGGGAEISLAADFVIGGPNACFRFPEASIGHAVTGGISARLTSMVGLLKAKELLILGKWVKADEALKLGLLTELSKDPKARALELALELIALPDASTRSSKASLERAMFPNMDVVLADEVNVASYCFAQGAANEAFSNFAARKVAKPATATHSNLKNGECLDSTPRNTGSNVGTSIVEIKVQASARELYQKLRRVPDLNTALKRAVAEFPDRTFVRFAGKDTSFADFHISVTRLAGGLVQSGVKRGDRVLVMMRNSLEMLHTWFATNHIGAIWVPINVELKSITLSNVAKAASAILALVDSEFFYEFRKTEAINEDRILVNGTGTDQKSLSDLYSLGVPIAECVNVGAGDVCAFLYTSGTTGKSKPCVLPHQYFILQALQLIESFYLLPSDVLYCPFPLFHADATALTTVPALLLGGIAALSVRFSASKFWDEIRESRATVYDFMGAVLAILYKNPPSPRDREHKIRLAWGVPIPQFVEDYERRFNHPLYTLYGSVEASIPITQPIDRPLIPGSCGIVTSGYTARIASDTDEPLPANTVGNLLLRSDQPNAFFHGYFNNSESTVQAYRNLWFHTGDLARIDDQGNVFFHGRTKDVVRRRGENINASEVEEELVRHPDIVIAAAYAIPSALAGGQGTEDDLKVAIVKREGSSLTETEVWEWTRANMARFQVPSVIEFVRELKQTPTGKIEKNGLRAEGGVTFSNWTAAQSQGAVQNVKSS